MSIFQDIKQKIERGMEQAGQTSQRMIEIRRYNSKIKTKKDELEKAMSRLGWAVFRAKGSAESLDINQEVQRGLNQVQVLHEQLRELETELDSITNIKNHETVEKVNFTSVGSEYLPSPQPVTNIPSSTVNTVPRVTPNTTPNAYPHAMMSATSNTMIYICPYCAHQIQENDTKCANCQHEYF